MTNITLPVHHIEVKRTARYYLLGEREGADEIWFVLHGYSMLASGFLRWFERAAKPGRLIVAPEALSRSYFEESGGRRIGASWMTREDREVEIRDMVGYLDQLASAIIGELPPRPRVEVHGFSQGAAAGCRWVTLGNHEADRVVLWGGTVPPDLDLDALRTALRDRPVVLVVGDRDRRVDPAMVANEKARLLQVGIRVDLRQFSGGHRVDQATLTRLSEEK